MVRLIYMEYLRNKKASFDYEFVETLEVGIKLSGSETKSIKNHHGSLNGAYVAVVGGELVLLGAHIPAWQEKNAPAGFDPYQTRKLLVHKKELFHLLKSLQTKGLTVIPISLYSKGPYIKVQLVVAKGKKNFDKRESLKKKAVKMDMDRGLRD